MSYRSGLSTPEWTDPAQAIDGLKQLSLEMCGGEDLHSYLAEFRAKGQSQCTNVWSKEIIAYRCRTCQLNESSAICVECFKDGNHEKHDYVMYHSESGGCCDCGDRAAWKESGFCTAHQRPVQDAVVRDELLQKTHMAVKFVLKELLVWVEKMKDVPTSSEKIDMAMIYLDWLQQVCSVDALRNIVCQNVLTKYIKFQEIGVTSPLNMLMDTLAAMSEKIIEAEATLFLQLLYRNDFKNDFAELLKNKYEGMIVRAVDDQEYFKNYKYLDTNLDRVMVQLFNDPDITTRLIYNHKLLELFVGVFCQVVSKCVDDRTPPVVDVEHEAVKGKVYLRPQGDVRLVVAHGDIAVNMLRNKPEIYSKILNVLVSLQWMNPYKLDDDIEFRNSWTLAIQLEMNSMAIIFQLVSKCCQDPQFGRETLVTAANYTLKTLNRYLMQVDFTSDTVSLHIPLHRTLSAILGKLVQLPWDQGKDGFLSGLDFTYTENEVLHLMEHPLSISFWMAQIRAQKWQRTSDEFSRLELIYRGSFWHDQSMDMDILMLQFCAVARQDMQEKIFTLMAKKFKLEEMVTSPVTSRGSQRPSDISLLRDFMRLILLVVRERRNLGLKDEKCLQYDVIQWLCVRDQTYSQLCRALSAIPMDHGKLNRTLKKVAIYHEPKVSDRGYYQLKAEYWKEFDPLFAHYYLNELEEAQERAVKVGKLEHYWRIIAPPVASAPYDRLSNLLHTQACHLFLMNVLSEVKNLVKLETTATAGEALGVTALQMMAVVLSDRRDNPGSAQWRSSFSEAAVGPTYSTKDISVNVYLRLDNQSEKHLSIHQMLLELQCAKNCTRLVDSVNHVLELLSSFSNSKPFGAEMNSSQMSVARLQVKSLTAEDEQRRLRKAHQQKAALEHFAARQKAFQEQVDDSFGNESPMESHHKEGQSVGERTSGSKGVLETSPEDVSHTFGSDCNSVGTEDDAKECVLCRSKSDLNNSATCWIALVQRYNMPNFVLSKGREVTLKNTDVSSTSGQFHGEGEGDTEQFVVMQEGSNCIDCLTTEHVQCCGHQMHFECFQVHFDTLQSSHSSGYAGKGILDLSRCEFLCPICRRLANVLLPDADASMSTRKLLAHEDRGGKESRKDGRSSWEMNQNLETAIDFFATQSKRVRGNFQFLGVETKGFASCKVLWEVLGQNIVHCEVETREVVVKEEAASSSSTPMQICEVHVWGGDSAHWIALRELGKLAMLVNTLPSAEQEKTGLRVKLRRSLGLCGEREVKRARVLHRESASYADGMIETIKIMEEMFGEQNLDPIQPKDTSLYTSSFQDGESGKEMLVSTFEDPANMDEHMEERGEKDKEALEPDENVPMIDADMSTPVACNRHQRNSALSYPRTDGPLYPKVNRLECQDDQLKKSETYQEDRKSEVPKEVVPPSSTETEEDLKHWSLDQLKKSETYQEDRKSEVPKEVVLPSSTETEEDLKHWSSDLLNNGVLAADPFGLLIVLLLSFKGQPKQRQILAMVKFAYTVAVIQTESAVRTAGADPSFSNLTLQGACLPFLRRAAILVQIVTPEDFRRKSVLPGRKVMDAHYLQQALELPECREILDSNSGRGRGTLVTHLQNYVEKVTRFNPKLYRVPCKVLLYGLPRVFQELLLKHIHNKEECDGKCRQMPQDPAICLLCGKLLCCGTDCCKDQGIGECSKHAAEESAGVGIFLLLRSTQLLLLRNNRFCMGPSIYLDTHGEEDLYLRRSQLLHLSDLRLNEVRRLYLTAAFDYDSYILHNSQSRPNYY